MQVQVNTDNGAAGRATLNQTVEAEIRASVARFADRLTRVEAHLSDENGGKSGADDKRCMSEARSAGQQPVTVTHHGATFEEACEGAAEKLAHLLESKFGRLHQHKGAASIRDNDRR